jgi:hypothetical protein
MDVVRAGGSGKVVARWGVLVESDCPNGENLQPRMTKPNTRVIVNAFFILSSLGPHSKGTVSGWLINQ